MTGIFIWTVIILFTGIFIGYAIGSYVEHSKIQKRKKNP